jgi:hypothetical protein
MGFRPLLRLTVVPISCLIAIPALAVQTAPTSIPHPQIEAREMVRNVNTPWPTAWRPSEAEQQGPLDLFVIFRELQALRRWQDAYSLLSPGLQGLVGPAEWTALAKEREWPLARIELTRITWYPDLSGTEGGLRVALDFKAMSDSGNFMCGYVAMLTSTGSPYGFLIGREEISTVPATLLTEGLPDPKVLEQLPCWLGDGIKTELNSDQKVAT